MTDTPETDHIEINLGNAAHPILSSFCRKLERERDEARESAQKLLYALNELVELNTEMTSDDCTYERAYYCYYKGHYDKWKLAAETIAALNQSK